MQICPPKLIFIIQNNFQNNFESQILTVFMQNIPVIMSIHTFPLSMYIFCRIQLRFFSSFGSFVIEFAKSLIWCRIAAHITLGRLLYLLTYHPIFRRKKLIHLTRLPCFPTNAPRDSHADFHLPPKSLHSAVCWGFVILVNTYIFR